MAKVKPQTPLAKADAALDADHRKAYRQFDDDARRFGKRVASYNAGFTRGWADGKKKGMRARSPRRGRKA
jgi:hypothetical protein